MDDSCECTGSTFEVEQCDTCKTVLSTTTIVEATGHPQDQLVDYGADSTAKECKKCGHVLFGSWEQDGDKTNGAEPIEWIKSGSQLADNTQLLVSLHCIAREQFDTASKEWYSCTLRTWLNSDSNSFYDSAFSDNEKLKIQKKTGKSYCGSYQPTSYTFRIDLLSVSGITDLDTNSKIASYSRALSGSKCDWWLTNSEYGWAFGTRCLDASYVGSNGETSTRDVTWKEGVRPILYFKVSETS